MKTLEALRTLDHIMHVDDEREMGNSIIVTLAEGWFFADEPDCGVQGFDKVSDARRGCARKKVVYDPERYARLNAPAVPVSAPQPQSVVDAAEVSAYEAVHARIVSGEISSTRAIFSRGWHDALAHQHTAKASGQAQACLGDTSPAPIGYANPKHLHRMEQGGMQSLSVLKEHSPDEAHTEPVYRAPYRSLGAAGEPLGDVHQALEPFLAVIDAFDPAEDDAFEPWKDALMDADLRLTLGQFRALRAAIAQGTHALAGEVARLTAENATLRKDQERLDRGYIMTGIAGTSACEHRGLDLRACIDRVTELDAVRSQRRAGPSRTDDL